MHIQHSRILMVENNVVLAAFLQRFFKMHGLDIQWAADFQEALDALSLHPALVLM